LLSLEWPLIDFLIFWEKTVNMNLIIFGVVFRDNEIGILNRRGYNKKKEYVFNLE